jgi:hypothetical protein
VDCGLRIAEFAETILVSTKSQAPNNKQISITKTQNDKQNDLCDLNLGFIWNLKFAVWGLIERANLITEPD